MGIFQHLPIKYIDDSHPYHRTLAWELIDPSTYSKQPPYQSSCKVMALAMVTPSLTIWGTYQKKRSGWHGGLLMKKWAGCTNKLWSLRQQSKNNANIRDKSSNFDHHPQKTLSKHLNAPKRPTTVPGWSLCHHPNVIIPTWPDVRDAWKDSRCSTTLRPLGPKVTLTALATALMPPWSLGCNGNSIATFFAQQKWCIIETFQAPPQKIKERQNPPRTTIGRSF